MDTPHVVSEDGYAIIDRDDLWNEERSTMRVLRARQKLRPATERETIILAARAEHQSLRQASPVPAASASCTEQTDNTAGISLT
jgi:hypothetical protein